MHEAHMLHVDGHDLNAPSIELHRFGFWESQEQDLVRYLPPVKNLILRGESTHALSCVVLDCILK